MALALASCDAAQQTSVPDTSADSTPTVETPAESTPATTPADPASTPATGNTSGDNSSDPSDEQARVTLYVMDATCNDYVQKNANVSEENAISDAVGEIIRQRPIDNLELTGYRVTVDAANGTATVDLGLNPDSERQFVSLSSCEQRSLFGSIEETLLKNQDWQIKTIEFTSQGNEILM